MAWPGLHRADGAVLIGTQSGSASGDASRDLAAQLLAALAAEAGQPVLTTPPVPPTARACRTSSSTVRTFDVTVHEGFDFWVEGQDLEGDAAASLERANETVVPTTRMAALPSAYWVPHRRPHPHPPRAPRRRGRRHRRSVPAARRRRRRPRRRHPPARAPSGPAGCSCPCGTSTRPSRPATTRPSSRAWGERYAAALAVEQPLNADERRARSGLLSRQVTLR